MSRHKATFRNASGQTCSKPGILIIDDDSEVAAHLAALGRSLGYPASFVTTRDALFEHIRDDPPAVVLVDLFMPDHDGLEIMRELGQSCQAKIIVSSGCDRRLLETVRQAAVSYGLDVVGILPKPVRRDALAQIMVHASNKGGPRRDSKLADTMDAFLTFEDHEVTNAMAENQFEAFFQPKLSLHSNKICGFEALVRWRHPTLGIIAPDLFLPTVTALGLQDNLTAQVLSQAGQFLASFSDPALSVAINAQLELCGSPTFYNALQTCILSNGLSPGQLVIEVTEAGSGNMPQWAIDALMRLRMQGFVLSIDDFGTGVSSLERLIKVPFEELKIDRSFVTGLHSSDEKREVISTLVRLAKTFDMFVTVEGVEDGKTLEIVRELGCDVAQGYYVGRPMPALEAAAAYRARESVPIL